MKTYPLWFNYNVTSYSFQIDSLVKHLVLCAALITVPLVSYEVWLPCSVRKRTLARWIASELTNQLVHIITQKHFSSTKLRRQKWSRNGSFFGTRSVHGRYVFCSSVTGLVMFPLDTAEICIWCLGIPIGWMNLHINKVLGHWLHLQIGEMVIIKSSQCDIDIQVLCHVLKYFILFWYLQCVRVHYAHVLICIQYMCIVPVRYWGHPGMCNCMLLL